jgi:hypothetical protein
MNGLAILLLAEALLGAVVAAVTRKSWVRKVAWVAIPALGVIVTLGPGIVVHGWPESGEAQFGAYFVLWLGVLGGMAATGIGLLIGHLTTRK